MPRIIGGKNRSRKINRVDLISTRETSDNVREAVFNLLNQQLKGIVVDLFAGSGAYGLESLSRGADFCYFFDNNKKAISTILANAKLLDELNKCQVKLLDYKDALSYITKLAIKIDYLFLDPPYNLLAYQKIIEELRSNINTNGYVIVEAAKNTAIYDRFTSLTLVKERMYGNKKIVIYQKL